MYMIIPKEIRRVDLYKPQSIYFITLGSLFVFFVTFWFQWNNCTLVIRPVVECEGSELLRNVLVSDSMSLYSKNKYIPILNGVDMRMMNLIYPFRGYTDSPMIAQYVQYVYADHSDGYFSFTPLQKLIPYSDLFSLVDGFNYSLTHLNSSNDDCYTVSSSDPLLYPPFHPNFTWSSPICGHGVKVDFTFVESTLIKVNDYGNGSMTFYEYYTDYFMKYIFNADYPLSSRTDIVERYIDMHDIRMVNVTKSLLIQNFMGQLSGDFGTGVCNGVICNSFSLVLITSLLNMGSSIPILGCIFTFIIFKYHKREYGIDLELAINEKDKVITS